MIRPLHRRLSDESVALMDLDRAAGRFVLPVHLMLVDDSGPREVGRVACGEGLGEWVTGDGDQVTCPGCKELVHG